MAVIMRELTDPSDAKRRHKTRRATLYDAPTFIEKLLPSSLDFWRVPDVETDAVITANNPVLAIVLLKQALSMGLDCILTSDGGDDDWPYDLATHPHTIAVLASALAMKPTRYGDPERFLAGLSEEFVAPAAAKVRKLPPSVSLAPHFRQHDGEITLTAVPSSEPPGRDEHREATWGILGAALASSALLPFDLKNRTGVFARRAVVTGRNAAFAPSGVDGTHILYDNRLIHPVGTAARFATTNSGKARMMVDDIVRCTRFEF